MLAVSLFSAITFSLASLIIGIRLLVLARSTRQLPELLIGLSFLFGGFVGHSIAYVVRMSPAEAESVSLVLNLLSRLFIATGCGTMTVAAWQIFRRQSRWALLLTASLLVLLLSYVLRDQLIGSLDRVAALLHPAYWLSVLATTASYGWMSWESFHRQRMLRRQQRHGLGGNPILARRILLWTIGCTSIALLFSMLPVLRVLEHVWALPPLGRIVIAILGLICAVAMWLAFFPPRSVVRRVDRTPEQG